MAVNAKGEEITSIWTPANIITCVRIAFIPLFMIASEVSFAVAQQSYDSSIATAAAWAFSAFVLYVLLSATDKVDGDLARKRGEVTDFGKFLDPIADKLLVFSALLVLLEHGYVNVWFDKLGKWKTAVTMVSLCSYLLGVALAFWSAGSGVSTVALVVQVVAQVSMVAAVILTVVSGAQYFWNLRHVVFSV
mgnify:CR=1 FL=1